MVTLCEALRYAHKEGALANLESLYLSSNEMGDRGAAALASVLQEGAMANLETLGLYSCGIGEAWMVALASAAVGGGAVVQGDRAPVQSRQRCRGEGGGARRGRFQIYIAVGRAVLAI